MEGRLTGVASRPWAAEVAAVAAALETDVTSGLGSHDAARRLVEYGPNQLAEQDGPGRWHIFARQFTNTMTMVLAVAAGVTLVIGDRQDTVMITLIVLLNAAVGYVQEYRAEQAMAALASLTVGIAHVVRDGLLSDVAAPSLVPGDLVELAAGDVVPADVRLVEVHGLRINEAALTGEAESSAKTSETLAPTEGALVADRHNMAFKGTAVVHGRARGVVVATGMDTELGQIAALLQSHAVELTPLQRRLAQLGRRMAAAAVVVCAVVFVSGLLRGESAEEMFLTSVTLAVAAIPEGLPAVVTVALALGARRMAERRAVIRRLPAVETLGSVSVICTDKTGTLTENRMIVEKVWSLDGLRLVTGHGYSPDGEIDGVQPPFGPSLVRLAEIAAACNDAVLHAPASVGTGDVGGGAWTITGDPTEGALLAFAGKLGLEREQVIRQWPRIAEVAFDAERRRMTTVHRRDGRVWIATKGALSSLLPLLRPDDRASVAAATSVADALSADGYRVLALADREVEALTEPLADLEQTLHLRGLVAIADPPRPEVPDAVAQCRTAGITPVMITGDHPGTAAAIARRLGILGEGDPAGGQAGGQAVVSGDDLDGLEDRALGDTVVRARVFARTDPAQKLRIVDAWKAQGAIVAMTGDGVNDAPALRRSDIGVAMGVVGTDVSKEAADMVLADDNFATIVHAVEEGRRIYDSIRRFVRYLLTTNSGEVWVMFLAPLIGLPVPLLPVQILWINLVTDGPPAIALGLEPAEPDTMRRPPRPPDESILAGGLWQHAVWVGLLMAAVVLPLQAVTRAADWPWQTMVFMTLAFLQLGHALAVRSERRSLFSLGWRSNPWIVVAVACSGAAQCATVFVPALHEPFGTQSLTAVQLAVVGVASTTVFLAVEIEKWLWRRRWLRGGTASGRSHP